MDENLSDSKKSQTRKRQAQRNHDPRKVEISLVPEILHHFWQACKTQPFNFWGCILASVGYILFLNYLNTYYMSEVLDRLSAGTVATQDVFVIFGPSIVMLVLVNVLGQVSSKLQDYFCAKLEIGANYELARRAFETLNNQSMTFHANRYSGSMVSQTTRFMGAFNILCDTLTYSLIPTIASVVLTFIMLAPVAPLYVLVLALFLLIYTFITFKLYKKVLPYNAQSAAAANKLSGVLSDAITNILTVKTYGREDYESQLFAEANRDLVQADSARMIRSIKTGGTTAGMLVVIMSIASVFVVGGQGWFGMSAGALVMLFSYTYNLTMRFNMLASTMQNINRAFGDATDMTKILREPQLVKDDDNAQPLEVTAGAIDMNNLSFKYADATNYVFKDLNLHVPAGQRIGLVGRSGAGKSTLTKLLLRLNDIQSGEILVDGQNIAHCTQQSLRQHIAYVPQEALLFHRSIRENIAYGNIHASDEEIRAAAERANALEFIEQLPDGLDTLVGERGVKLSGGQRQRIAIARALLADAPILVLDEATSALDSESEHLVQEALARLMEGRTALVVAHRLSTVASLDRIILLDETGIAEDGAHDELIAQGGAYAHLWQRQTGAFLETES